MVEHFLRRHAFLNGCDTTCIDNDAVERLKGYPWPGNVRELENVVERMIVFAGGDALTLNDLPEEILQWPNESELADLSSSSFQAARTLFERRYLREALQRHNGVISKAARAIGMSRKNLYMRLDNLRIDYDRYRERGRQPEFSPVSLRLVQGQNKLLHLSLKVGVMFAIERLDLQGSMHQGDGSTVSPGLVL